MAYNILVINPGATSTKIAWYEDTTQIFEKNIMHSIEELAQYPEKAEQMVYRKELILKTLEEEGVDMSKLSAVACRGGTFGGLIGGAYLVDDALIEKCMEPSATHPSSWAAVMGRDIAEKYGVNAYIYDAVGSDETTRLAHLTGIKGLYRKNRTHSLNTRAVCKKAAADMGINYADGNFIAVHLGGGSSINVHSGGKIIDCIATEEGPMSTERSGSIHYVDIIKMAYSGEYTQKELTKYLIGGTGLKSLLGTNDMREVEKRIAEGDEWAAEVVDFWSYQIAKYVAYMASVVYGKVDKIVVTGGAAYSQSLTSKIIERCQWMAPVQVIPGALEMEALATGIKAVLDGEEEAKLYGQN
ncbi:MAG: butyrate kinase [Clostridiales bacterium]|nr:butyrate kinase [Candidatus Crickella merdequi]